MLPERDITYLEAHWPGYVLQREGNEVAVVLPRFELPVGFSPGVVELLLMVPFGYPDAPLDMFWVDPPVTICGAAPEATTPEFRVSRQWQRFSRHLAAGSWKPGIDDVQAYLAMVRTILSREAALAVA